MIPDPHVALKNRLLNADTLPDTPCGGLTPKGLDDHNPATGRPNLDGPFVFLNRLLTHQTTQRDDALNHLQRLASTEPRPHVDVPVEAFAVTPRHHVFLLDKTRLLFVDTTTGHPLPLLLRTQPVRTLSPHTGDGPAWDETIERLVNAQPPTFLTSRFGPQPHPERCLAPWLGWQRASVLHPRHGAWVDLVHTSLHDALLEQPRHLIPDGPKTPHDRVFVFPTMHIRSDGRLGWDTVAHNPHDSLHTPVCLLTWLTQSDPQNDKPAAHGLRHILTWKIRHHPDDLLEQEEHSNLMALIHQPSHHVLWIDGNTLMAGQRSHLLMKQDAHTRMTLLQHIRSNTP